MLTKLVDVDCNMDEKDDGVGGRAKEGWRVFRLVSFAFVSPRQRRRESMADADTACVTRRLIITVGEPFSFSSTAKRWNVIGAADRGVQERVGEKEIPLDVATAWRVN